MSSVKFANSAWTLNTTGRWCQPNLYCKQRGYLAQTFVQKRQCIRTSVTRKNPQNDRLSVSKWSFNTVFSGNMYDNCWDLIQCQIVACARLWYLVDRPENKLWISHNWTLTWGDGAKMCKENPLFSALRNLELQSWFDSWTLNKLPIGYMRCKILFS